MKKLFIYFDFEFFYCIITLINLKKFLLLIRKIKLCWFLNYYVDWLIVAWLILWYFLMIMKTSVPFSKISSCLDKLAQNTHFMFCSDDDFWRKYFNLLEMICIDKQLNHIWNLNQISMKENACECIRNNVNNANVTE
jgi:hypothetical protein